MERHEKKFSSKAHKAPFLYSFKGKIYMEDLEKFILKKFEELGSTRTNNLIRKK